MHRFALSRADDPAKAIAAHAQGRTTRLHRRRHRPPRPDEGPRDASRAPAGHQRAARSGADRSVAGRRPAHRRAGSDERRGGGHGRAPALSRHRREPAVRRIRPTAQHGVDRRQHHAAHALRLFPRRRWPPVQQAASPAPAARRATASIAITRSSDGPTPVLPPILPTSRWHSRRSTRTSLCAGWRESDRFRSRTSIACPAARRSATTCSTAAT